MLQAQILTSTLITNIKCFLITHIHTKFTIFQLDNTRFLIYNIHRAKNLVSCIKYNTNNQICQCTKYSNFKIEVKFQMYTFPISNTKSSYKHISTSISNISQTNYKHTFRGHLLFIRHLLLYTYLFCRSERPTLFIKFSKNVGRSALQNYFLKISF